MTDERQALITTFSGKMVDPFNPDPEQICLSDIAQSLSLQVRFCGHINDFLSVAQHCVMVSDMCETELGKKWGLLHDASEAYISDVPRPLKQHLSLFREVEERLFRAIAERFKLDYPMPDEVAFYDYVSLHMESRDFMPNGACVPKPEGYEVPSTRLAVWEPKDAKERFRQKCWELLS